MSPKKKPAVSQKTGRSKKSTRRKGRTARKVHTLEKLAKAVHDDEKLHSALMLAFVNSIYQVLAGSCVPTPLYRLLFNKRTSHLDLDEAQGSSSVPKKNGLDIRALDILVVANLRNIPVLFEGETGVGKTYISHSFLKTIFPKDCFISLRLSGNSFLNNIFQPFLEGSIKDGMPVTEINQEKIDNVAGMFVDEINRGDPQNILQLLDNELYNAGQFVRLGIKIPELEKGKLQSLGPRQKKLDIITAQNPASTNDAKFTSTLELDAAVDNRLLRIEFGNAANSAGTTLWLGDGSGDAHVSFLDHFADLAAEYLDVKPSTFNTLADDWLSLYAWIADPQRTDKSLLYSGFELADLLICAMGGGIIEKFEYERSVLKDWFRKFKIKLPVDFKIAKTKRVEMFEQVFKTFKIPVIFRDIIQIKKLADVVSTLTMIKDACRDKNPVEKYQSANNNITVKEVAGAAALVALNKQVFGSASAVPAINEIMMQYVSTVTKIQKGLKYLPEKFDINDRNAGIKRMVLVGALKKSFGKRNPAMVLRTEIIELLEKLMKYISTTEEIGNLLLMRSSADLMTLCGFLAEHEKDVIKVLNEANGDYYTAIDGILDLYESVREKFPMTIPEIYQHRIKRTLGG